MQGIPENYGQLLASILKLEVNIARLIQAFHSHTGVSERYGTLARGFMGA